MSQAPYKAVAYYYSNPATIKNNYEHRNNFVDNLVPLSCPPISISRLADGWSSILLPAYLFTTSRPTTHLVRLVWGSSKQPAPCKYPVLPENYLLINTATTQETTLAEQVEQFTRARRDANSTPSPKGNSSQSQEKNSESSQRKTKSEPGQSEKIRTKTVVKDLEDSAEKDLVLKGGHPIVLETTTTTLIPPRRTRPTLPVRILTKATPASPDNGFRPSLSPSTANSTGVAQFTTKNGTNEVTRKESISMPEDKDRVNFNVKQPNVLEKNEENDKELGLSDKKAKSRLETSLWEDFPPEQDVNFKSNSSSSIQQSSVPHADYLNILADCLVFAGPGLAVLLACYPTSLLLRRFGSRKVIAVALLVSGSLTASLPFLAAHGRWAIVALRFGVGLCFSPALTFIGVTAANWGSLKEQLWFVTMGMMALQMAPILSWLVSVYFGDLSRQGLLRVFGVHATLSAILLIVWLIFYRDTPQKHRAVNGLELNRIVTGKAQHNRLLEVNAFSLLLKSSSAWGAKPEIRFYNCHISGFDDDQPLCSLLVDQVFGASSTLKVRLFNTFGLLTAAVSFVLLAAIPPTHYFAARSVWLLWICLIPLGLTTAGFIESAVVCGRFYSQFIVANLQIAFGLAMFAAPVMVFVLINSINSPVYWRLVFLAVGAVLCLSAAVFAILGRGQPSGWARNSWADPTISHKMQGNIDPISRYDDCGLIEMKTLEEFTQHQNHPSTALLGSHR
uniref:Major facilitator superfamily (MFS) profile domain-containing protein n=1 Tax=Ditylenchus dipsaci TaxID=166011 RepID=A0A915EJA3_9BILA